MAQLCQVFGHTILDLFGNGPIVIRSQAWIPGLAPLVLFGVCLLVLIIGVMKPLGQIQYFTILLKYGDRSQSTGVKGNICSSMPYLNQDFALKLT